MKATREDIEAFRRQLEHGSIQKAYKALMSFMLSLRTRMRQGGAGYEVSGLYQGYLDRSHFALFPPALKQRDLKVAILFRYEAFRFEGWLVARNRRIQRQVYALFQDSVWPAYRVIKPATGVDSIVECDLAADPDLTDTEALAARIESGVGVFIADLERFLAERQPPQDS